MSMIELENMITERNDVIYAALDKDLIYAALDKGMLFMSDRKDSVEKDELYAMTVRIIEEDSRLALNILLKCSRFLKRDGFINLMKLIERSVLENEEKESE